MPVLSDDEANNLDVFKDSVSAVVIEKLAPTNAQSKKRSVRGRKNEIKPVARTTSAVDTATNDAAELGEFAEVPLTVFRQSWRSLSLQC